MARRGPKPKTLANGLLKAPAGSLWAGFRPPAGEAVRAEFDRLVANVRAAGTLDRTDPRLVEAAARVAVLIVQAWAEIERDGLTLKAYNTTMPHPMLAVVNSSTMRLKSLLTALGLTAKPGKRGEAAPADDKWGDLLRIPRHG